MKSTSLKLAALTFIALLQANGVLLAKRKSTYQVDFAISHYNASEAQGKLTLSLKTNSTSTNNKTMDCKTRNETISMTMPQHYQVTLNNLRKYRKCENVTLIIKIIDDKMYEYNKELNVTLISGNEERILIGPISEAVIRVEDDDVIEVYFETDDIIRHVVSEGNGSYLLPLIFNTTVQEGVTAVEISVVCGSANCREDLNCTLKVFLGNLTSTNLLGNVDKGRRFFDTPLEGEKEVANRTIIGTIPIFIIDDSVVEHNENFTVGISSRDSRVIIAKDQNETIVIIEDNDVLSVEFRSSNVTVSEGSRTLLTLDTNGTASFNYSVHISINNIQTGPEDYSYQSESTTARSVKVTFPAGRNTSSVDITVIRDNAFENEEKFTAAITSTSDPTKILIGMQNQTTVTIENIDTFNVSFMEAVYTISEDCDMDMIPILFQLPQNGSHVKITVAVNSTDITATNGRDYNYTATVTLGVTNNSSATEEILLFIEQDDILEGDESFTLELVLPSNVKVTEEKKIKVFIQDANTVSIDFTSSMGTVNESNGSFNLTLVANGTATFDYDVNISISESIESSQAKFCDHNTQSTEMKNVQFPAGCTYVTVSIQVDDEVFENNTEIFTAEIMSTSHSSVVKGGNNTAMISIIDDDIIKVYFQNASYSYLENSGTVQIPILFILPNNGSEVNVIVDVISNKENASGLTDFNFPSSVTLHPTCMSKALLNLSITIENDTTLERNEDFNFTLQARDPMNRIQIVNNSVAFTILNDDGLSVGFATTMEVVNESEGTFLLRLEATGTAPFDYTVNITIQNNSTDFDDHNISAGMEVEVKFQAWNRTAGVVIDIDDEVYENSETFTAKISSTSDDNVGIGMNITTYITIMDNDNITVCFQDTTNAFLENKGFVRVPVHANLPKNGSQVDVMLSVVFTNQTAINPDDYGYNMTEYTFANTFNANATVYLHINIVDDFMVERNETFGIEVSTMQPRVEIVDSMNINVTILNDDDLAVGFLSSTTMVNESEGTFMLMLEATTTASFSYTVTITIQNKSTNFDDHNISSIMEVEFTPRNKKAGVVIGIDDKVYENNETFTAEISSTSDKNVYIGTNQTIDVTIMDNDNITIYFQEARSEISENEGSLAIPLHVRLPTNGSQVDVTLQINIIDINATHLVDFILNLTNCTLVIFNTSKNFIQIPLGIYIVNETIVEFDEIFHIEVETTHRRVNILHSTRVSILNDDVMSVEFKNKSSMVVDEQEGEIIIPLKANSTSGFEFKVNLSLMNVTTSSSDFSIEGPLVVTFPPNTAEANITIQGINDHVYENTETFELIMTGSSYPSKIFIGDNNITTINITDDEVVQVSFDGNPYTAKESDEQITIHLKASLPKGGSEVPFFVTVESMDESAKSEYDYQTFALQIVNFSNHSRAVQFEVDLVNNNMSEEVEKFLIGLKSISTRINITTKNAVVQIEDDDPCPCGIGGTCVYHTYNFSCDCLQDYLGTHCQIYVGEARIGISIGVGVAASIAGAIILIVTAILIVVSCWPKHTLQLKEDDQKRKAKSNNTDTTSFSKSISRNAEA